MSHLPYPVGAWRSSLGAGSQPQVPSPESLQKNVLDANLRVDRAVALGAAHPLAAFLLEDPDFRASGLAVDHRNHARVGDKWSAGEHFAAVLLDDEHLLERQFGARLTGRTEEGCDAARRHLHLMPARLDDCVH